MSKLGNHRIQQCGVCAQWTADGRNIESTNRNESTRVTEHANFICRHCECEKRNLNLVDKALDERLKK
jgi:hypothetical protein